MLNSALSDNLITDGSNKHFVKLKDEENAAKKKALVDELINSEQEYLYSLPPTYTYFDSALDL